MTKRTFLRSLGGLAAGALLHVVKPLAIAAPKYVDPEWVDLGDGQISMKAAYGYLLIADPNAFTCYNVGPAPKNWTS